MRDLIDLYRSSRSYRKITQSSRETYERYLSFLAEEQFTTYDAREADAKYEAWRAARGEHFAFHVVKVARVVFNTAQRYGAPVHNPWARLGPDTPAGRTVIWSKGELDAVLRAARRIDPCYARLVMLCYWSAQRPGDVARMTSSALAGRVLSIKQAKTGADVHVALPGRILSDLGAPYLCGWAGTPPSPATISRRLSEIKAAAGVRAELQLRDLRRTAITHADEAGCDERELTSLSGHASTNTLKHYALRRPEKALAVLEKRERTL